MRNGKKKILIDDSSEPIDQISEKLSEILFCSEYIICLVTKNDESVTFTNIRPSEVILSSITPMNKIDDTIKEELEIIAKENGVIPNIEENVIIDSIPPESTKKQINMEKSNAS